MSKFTFDYYKVPDPLDNVQALADEMSLLGRYPERYNKLLIDTYEETLFENVDIEEVVSLMDKITYQNAKIMISGKYVLESDLFKKGSKEIKEQWMKTKYKTVPKPSALEIELPQFSLPQKNPLIPESFEIYAQ